MSLGGWLDTLLPESGSNTTSVKPINDGVFHQIVPDQEGDSSVWGFLDGLGDQVSTGVGNFIKGKIEKELDRQTYGAEASQDSTGDPNYQAGVVGKPVEIKESFVEKYKMPLLVSAGLLTGLLVLKKL